MLTDSLARIVEAGPEDRAAVMATLIAAFEGDASVRILYPEDDAYRAGFPGFAEAFAAAAWTGGRIDRTVDGLGAAIWFPPGVHPDGDAIGAHMEASIPPERLGAIAAGLEAQGRFHPEAPHWYLPWIAVRPEAQGNGIGGALLRHGLDRADRERMPAYLEATSARNAALYAWHGFEVVGVVESPGYPRILPMWRPARTAG
jgi:GNAT superfamily N-acetyltransferase